MHDGSIATLDQVIRQHYALAGRATASTGQPSPARSEFVMGFEVSDEEVVDLVAFLHSLTDQTLLTDPRWANPWPGQPAGAQASSIK
jgi:cytochrome c peroxidase